MPKTKLYYIWFMDALFKKLNYKEQDGIHALNVPDTFDANLMEMASLTKVYKAVGDEPVHFAIGFVTQQAELNSIVNAVAPQLAGDAIFWMCYPKGSSKKYKCDFNRDTGWDIMGQYQLEPVRQVAIDEDWSALRFRKISYIKNFNRRETMALSKEGKERAANRDAK